MDKLDFGILAALHTGPRMTFEQLGHRVGLSANAAKERLRRMQADGVVQGFAALPDPALVGLRDGLLLFTGVDDLDEREAEILRGLAEVPGVRFADAGLDHTVYVWVLHRDDADWERIERAAVSLVGKPPARAARAEASGEPGPLAPADIRIIRAMQHDGRALVKDVTARSGLTAKPVKRRLERLLRDGSLRILPIISPADASGSVLFRVVCFLEPDAPVPQIESTIATQEAPGVVSFLAQRATLRDARELQRTLAAIPGVERAWLQLGTRRASLTWLDDVLARSLAPMAAAAPVAPIVPLTRSR